VDRIGQIIALVAGLSASAGFAFRGWTNWHINKTPENNEENKKRTEGKIHGIGGTSVFIALGLVLAFVLNNPVAVEEPINPLINEITTENQGVAKSPETNVVTGTGNVYVQNQRYDFATFSGYIDENRIPHGKGIMRFDNGNVFDGDWVHGVINGQGKMTYANGDIYIGEWANNMRNGKGTYTWVDNREYRGEYIDDMRYGEGTFMGWFDIISGFKGTYIGHSVNDMFEGQGVFVFDNGDRFEGYFKEDVAWNGIFTKGNGSTSEIKNGEPMR